MCVILLQIHEIIMFYFCELYHEIIKQEIFLKSNETQQGGWPQNGHHVLYISSHQTTLGRFLVC